MSGIITPRASFAQKSQVRQNLAGKVRWAGRTVEIAGTRICFFCVYRYKNGASMSHPTALAQCERFFQTHPGLKRVPAEDTAGSVRDVLASGEKSAAGIAGRQAAIRYGGVILSESIQDNAENFTRFVLLIPAQQNSPDDSSDSAQACTPAVTDLMTELLVRRSEVTPIASTLKVSLALRLAHQPGALLAALQPFAEHGINLLKIESRPIHGRPWEYQFFLDVQTDASAKLDAALIALTSATSFLRILGIYPPARPEQ